MNLSEAIAASGMTPPREFTPDKWLRFPGIGKGPSNRAGWCKIITPTLAIFGDWSSGLSQTWIDDSHRDNETSKRLLAEARQRAREEAARNRARQTAVAMEAARLIRECVSGKHPYLAKKGFPELPGLIHGDRLVIPMRDCSDYKHVISAQLISPDGKEKKFLLGGRASGAIYRIGVSPERARRVVLCEGYATGLSIEAALQRLPGPHMVVVCFSANNLMTVAENFPRAVVAADNDESKTGELAAIATGLPWAMPPNVGDDFNDWHQSAGLHAVVERMRDLLCA